MDYLYLFILSVVIAWIRLLCTRCCCNNNHLYPAKPARRKATRAGNFRKTPMVFGNYMSAEISRRHWPMVIRETETARSRNRAGKLRGKWQRAKRCCLEFSFSIVMGTWHCSDKRYPWALYTVSQKKQDTNLLPITSPNICWFSQFFHC